MAFQIVRNDITKIKADAIVNTANPEPVYMAGTDAAVYKAAGEEELLEERRKIGVIEEGEVAVTPAFALDAKYIFHTVGPVWQGGDKGEKETVTRCYQNCLEKAVELGISSIAFPLIATGVYGFPKTDALLIATSVFSAFLSENELDITLVVFDSESFELSGKIFAGINQYIDDNYVAEKTSDEYDVIVDECSEALEDNDPREIRRRMRGDRLFGSISGSRAKGTFHLKNSIEAAPAAAACEKAPPRSLDDVVRNLSDTWSECLLRMITEKGYSDTEVYKRANVDRKLFSKIRSNANYQPKKSTALAFALALRLNLDETKDFLGRAGYALSNSSKTDLIVSYFIEQGVYDIMTINVALFDHKEPLLG